MLLISDQQSVITSSLWTLVSSGAIICEDPNCTIQVWEGSNGLTRYAQWRRKWARNTRKKLKDKRDSRIISNTFTLNVITTPTAPFPWVQTVAVKDTNLTPEK